MRTVSRGPEETRALGQRLGAALRGPAVVALRGGLGVGKTAFVGGLALGLGVEDRVTSPTFALVHEYAGRLPLFHFDLYRLGGPDDLEALGWDDYRDRGGVCAVEWSERAGDFWPPDTIFVTLESHPEHPDWRIVTYDHPGV